jgi:hypothetical protein
MFCGCAEDASNGGKSEPMSFSSEICNRTQTRAAVDTSKHSGTNLIVHAAEPAKGITSNVSKMTRTSTSDGYWPNGANIAVQLGGTTKQYTVDSSGNITSSSPFYWANKNDISVTSWFPYSASLSSWALVNSDQSTETNYGNSDLLYSSGTLSYDGSKKLRYNHQTAKVVINIVKANGVTNASNISFVTIGTSGTPIDLSGTVGSTGTITASSTITGYITPYQTTSSSYAATYSALIIPQDMNGKQFIAIKVAGGNIFYYIPSTSTSLSGGYVYTYDITIPNSTTNVGDYYFNDGSWGTLAVHATSAVSPIGVIFSNSPNAIDKGYGWKHGYAMALTNASASSLYWSTYTSTDEAGDTFGNYTYADYTGDYTTFIVNKDGYSETHAIRNKTTYSQNTYPAFWYTLNYGTSLESGTTVYAAPAGSSGWFIPSVGQWWDILINLGGLPSTPTSGENAYCRWYSEDKTGDTNNYSLICATNINKYLTATSNKSKVTPDFFYNNNFELYWCSSESSTNDPYDVAFLSSGVNLNNSGYGIKSNAYSVRSAIAF